MFQSQSSDIFNPILGFFDLKPKKQVSMKVNIFSEISEFRDTLIGLLCKYDYRYR